MKYQRKEIIGKCTLYQGDCADILPYLETGSIVTDPPYGIGKDGATGITANNQRAFSMY